MVMSVLEARVDPNRWNDLRDAYAKRDLPQQVVESFLVQSASEPTLWRIVTIWRSQEDLQGWIDEQRAAGELPSGVVMFGAAGAEPTTSFFNVWDNPRRIVGLAQ